MVKTDIARPWIETAPNRVYRQLVQDFAEILQEKGLFAHKYKTFQNWIENHPDIPKRVIRLGKAKQANLRWFFILSCERAGIPAEYLRKRGLEPTGESNIK